MRERRYAVARSITPWEKNTLKGYLLVGRISLYAYFSWHSSRRFRAIARTLWKTGNKPQDITTSAIKLTGLIPDTMKAVGMTINLNARAAVVYSTHLMGAFDNA